MYRRYKLFLESLNGIIEVDTENSRPKLRYIRLRSMIDDTEVGFLEYSWNENDLYIAYVKTFIRGHKIGIKLIKRAIDDAKKMRLNMVTLKLPYDKDTEELRKMYNSLGFVTTTKNNSVDDGHDMHLIIKRDIITLYHGTCENNAKMLLVNGFHPNAISSGGNKGNSKYLYLTSIKENALWFAEEKGCDIIIEVKDIPVDYLLPDPEDEAGFTMKELLARRDMPSNYILVYPLDSKHFSVVDK